MSDNVKTDYLAPIDLVLAPHNFQDRRQTFNYLETQIQNWIDTSEEINDPEKTEVLVVLENVGIPLELVIEFDQLVYSGIAPSLAFKKIKYKGYFKREFNFDPSEEEINDYENSLKVEQRENLIQDFTDKNNKAPTEDELKVLIRETANDDKFLESQLKGMDRVQEALAKKGKKLRLLFEFMPDAQYNLAFSLSLNQANNYREELGELIKSGDYVDALSAFKHFTLEMAELNILREDTLSSTISEASRLQTLSGGQKSFLHIFSQFGTSHSGIAMRFQNENLPYKINYPTKEERVYSFFPFDSLLKVFLMHYIRHYRKEGKVSPVMLGMWLQDNLPEISLGEWYRGLVGFIVTELLASEDKYKYLLDDTENLKHFTLKVVNRLNKIMKEGKITMEEYMQNLFQDIKIKGIVEAFESRGLIE